MKALQVGGALVLLAVAAAGLTRALQGSPHWRSGAFAAVLLCLALAALVALVMRQRERLHDITRALDRSRLRAQGVIDASPDGIVLLREGRVRQANPAFRALLAIPADEELAGREFLGLVAESDRGRVGEWLERRQAGEVEPAQIDLTALRLSGTEIALEASGALVPSRHGRQFALFLRDVSQRRMLELRLRNLARLESLAEVAEGLAREFAKIFQNLRGMAQRGQQSDEPRESLARIERLSTRGTALARRVLQLAPEALSSDVVRSVGAAVLVQEVVSDFANAFEHAPEIRCDISGQEGLWMLVDPGQVRQALWQVLQNATEARPDGEIRLRVRPLELTESQLARHPGGSPGSYVLVAVKDDGPGMNETVRRRAFTPFFTTKGQRAQGLGLAMVYGVVRAHGGFVELDSMPGKGTVVRLAFPRAQAPPQTTPAAQPLDESLRWRGRETLLIVDDDPAAREEARALLEPWGYLVEVAASPREALHRLRHRPRIDLVLMDMVLPGWNGPDVLRRVLRNWPGQRVLMISPYPLAEQEELALHEGAVGIILKPLSEPELPRAVREALDRPPPAAMLTGPV